MHVHVGRCSCSDPVVCDLLFHRNDCGFKTIRGRAAVFFSPCVRTHQRTRVCVRSFSASEAAVDSTPRPGSSQKAAALSPPQPPPSVLGLSSRLSRHSGLEPSPSKARAPASISTPRHSHPAPSCATAFIPSISAAPSCQGDASAPAPRIRASSAPPSPPRSRPELTLRHLDGDTLATTRCLV